MSVLVKAQVSAGAQSVGIMNNIANILSQEQNNSREIEKIGSDVQGEAAQAEGQAQKNALLNEAASKGDQANMSFCEASGMVGGEVLGSMTESGMKNTESAKMTQKDYTNAEGWENGLRKLGTGEEVTGINKPPVNADALQKLTDDEIKNLKAKIVGNDGHVTDYNSLDVTTQKKLEVAKSTGQLDDVNAEVRYQVKSKRKAKDALDQGAQRKKQQIETYSKGITTFASATQALDQQKQQQLEADEKMTETSARFVGGVFSSNQRSLEELIGAQASSQKAMHDAIGQVFAANRA